MKTRIHLYILILILMKNFNEKKLILYENEVYLSLESVQSKCNEIWNSYLDYYSICFYSSRLKKFDFRNKHLLILLLLGGDIELNPGPCSNYTLRESSLCGYYKAAIFFVLNGKKLVPAEDDNDKEIDIPTGFDKLKNLFGEHFEINKLELDELLKRKNTFKTYPKIGIL